MFDSLFIIKLFYWVGQKIHLGFSIRWYGKTWMNALANPIQLCKGAKEEVNLQKTQSNTKAFCLRVTQMALRQWQSKWFLIHGKTVPKTKFMPGRTLSSFDLSANTFHMPLTLQIVLPWNIIWTSLNIQLVLLLMNELNTIFDTCSFYICMGVMFLTFENYSVTTQWYVLHNKACCSQHPGQVLLSLPLLTYQLLGTGTAMLC